VRVTHAYRSGVAVLASSFVLASVGAGTGAAAVAPAIQGIDVSSYQHMRNAGINWEQAARAGIRFAAIKVTEGTYYTNPYYGSDVLGALRAGMYVAPYVFANPHASGAASQARYAIARIGPRDSVRMLPIEVDLEPDPYTRKDHTNACYGLGKRAMVSWAEVFASTVRTSTGRWPLIYTTAQWWARCAGDTRALRRDPLWIAAYGTARPEMPAGWQGWTFWQYRSGARVSGVAYRGGVDLSYASSLFRALTTRRCGAPRHHSGRRR
jgi:GH25 family lysozyme M1 (1,4-beta-N-acetylmuramidase)